MPKVNVKKLKSKLTLAHYEKILKELGIPIVSKSESKWVLLTGCHHIHPETNGSPKLWFYTDSKIFTCFTQCACTYDIIGLVQKRLGLKDTSTNFMDAIQFIIDVTGIEFDSIQRISKNKYEYDWEETLGKFIRFRRTGSTLPEYDKSLLPSLEHFRPQEWLDEGISLETMEKYHIGIYERLDQITIPCFGVGGKLVGIRIRNKRPELLEQAKYMPLITLDNTVYKFDTNSVFYGINYNQPAIEQSQTVLLVEGEKSVLKADTWFGEQSNVLGLFGSQLGSKRRNELVQMGVKRVVLCLDSDFHTCTPIGVDPDTHEEIYDPEYIAFEKKMFKLAQMFEGYCTVDVVYNNIGLDGYKCSPFDFTKEIFEQLYENRVQDINSLITNRQAIKS